MAVNMWKNGLKNAESDNNKILYETLIDFFLQRNGTYFLNKPRSLYINYLPLYLKKTSDIITSADDTCFHILTCTMHLVQFIIQTNKCTIYIYKQYFMYYK